MLCLEEFIIHPRHRRIETYLWLILRYDNCNIMNVICSYIHVRSELLLKIEYEYEFCKKFCGN